MNLRRVEPQERRRANQREGPVVPARPRKSARVAERRAKKASAHDPIRTAEILRWRLQDRIGYERANRIHRTHPRSRSKMPRIERLAFIHRACRGAER